VGQDVFENFIGETAGNITTKTYFIHHNKSLVEG
jgi:hypothetical protein